MSIFSRIRAYPRHAWVAASFLVGAFVFGGGEHKGPATEIIVQALFAFAAVAWLWSVRRDGATRSLDQLIPIIVAFVILAVPAIQLVPLPPSIWQSLPGRGPAVASLALVGAENTWRPVSAVPLKTLATLLSMIPPLGLLYAVSRLDLHERSLVVKAVIAAALLTSLLGGLQLLAPDGRLTFYSNLHAHWVTGFQSNRNHAAEVLLAGLLALALVSRTARNDARLRNAYEHAGRNMTILLGGLALLLVAALVMTGSRSGIALGFPAFLAASVIVLWPSREGEPFPFRAFGGAAVVVVVLVLVTTFLISGEATNVGRAADRFADLGSTERAKVWADATYAFDQYWPFGIGAGGFIAAMLPVERLEFVNQSYPNQAHNDYLEIGIEAGLLAYVALGIVLLCLAYGAWRSWSSQRTASARTQILFAATVLIMLMLHSAVDYPLRSMSLACLAGAAGGMLIRTEQSLVGDKRRTTSKRSRDLS